MVALDVQLIVVGYLDVLYPSHVHPGLGLIRFEFDSMLVTLVERNTICSKCQDSQQKEG